MKLFTNLDDEFKYALLNQVQIQFFKASSLLSEKRLSDEEMSVCCTQEALALAFNAYLNNRCVFAPIISGQRLFRLGTYMVVSFLGPLSYRLASWSSYIYFGLHFDIRGSNDISQAGLVGNY